MYFDDDCGLCTQCVLWLRARSGGVEYVAMSHGIGVQNTVVLELADGACIKGAAAVGVVLRQCGQPWRVVGTMIGLKGVSALAAAVYYVVARNRSRISSALGWQACSLEDRRRDR